MAIAGTTMEERSAQTGTPDLDNNVSVEESTISTRTSATPWASEPPSSSLPGNELQMQGSFPFDTGTSSSSLSTFVVSGQRCIRREEQRAPIVASQTQQCLCLSWYPVAGCVICSKLAQFRAPPYHVPQAVHGHTSDLLQLSSLEPAASPIHSAPPPPPTRRCFHKPICGHAYAIEYANVDRVVDVQSTTVWRNRTISARNSLHTDYVTRRALDIDYVESHQKVRRPGKLYQPKIRKGKHGVRKALWGDKRRPSCEGSGWE